MATSLQYVAEQVASYLVATVGRLHYLGANVAKLVVVKVERDEIEEKVWLLKDKRCKFEERYVVLAGEKSTAED